MGHSAQIGVFKLKAARVRCDALSAAFQKFRRRTQASPGARNVVNALQHAVVHVKDHLKDLETDPIFSDLNESEAETKIQFASTHLPILHLLFGLIENSDIVAVPAEITAPVRREILRLFPEAELVVVASTNLNYSVVEITPTLTEIFEKLNRPLPPNFPKQIYRIAIPSVEYDQALLHCILAHELGHPLFTHLKILDKLGSIDVENSFLQAIINQLKKTPDSSGKPGDELNYIQSLTTIVNKIILNWVEELACDQFGLLLFGPAYLLAFLHFFSSTSLLDSASETHPSDRIRLKTMFDVLDKRYSAGDFSEHTKKFFDRWRPVAVATPKLLPIYALTWNWMQNQRMPEKLLGHILQTLDPKFIYESPQYKHDVRTLVPLINAQIPVAEVLNEKEIKRTSLTGILNAGWDAFLTGLTEFKKYIPDSDKLSEFELNVRFNRFLLKSMELNEVIRSWEVATNDPGNK